MKLRLQNAVSTAGIVILIWIFFIGSFNGISKAVSVVVCTPAVLIVLFFLSSFLSSHTQHLKKHGTKLLVIGLSVMLALLLLCGFLNRQNLVPQSRNALIDFPQTMRGAMDMAMDEPIENLAYFAKYSNNIPLLLTYAALGKLVVLLTGSAELLYPVTIILNGIIIVTTVLLCTLSVKMLSGPRAAAMCFLMCFVFVPFYLSMPLAYTDLFAMLSVAASVYLFLLYRKTNKARFIALSSVVIAAGAMYKITAAITGIALLIVMLLGNCKAAEKVKLSAVLIVSFAAVYTVLCAATTVSDPVPDSMANEYRFPPQHWIMMGLGETGVYNTEDAILTERAGDYAEKTAMCTEEILRRIDEKGFFGMLKHLFVVKVGGTWDSGTMGMYVFIQDPQNENLISSIIESDIPSKLLAAVCQGIYAAMLLCCVAAVFLKGKREAVRLLLLTIIGAFIFFMMWESNGRYLIQFMPVIIVTAAIGAGSMFDSSGCIISKILKK